tara:strand:+ start:12174 stop:13556 length:1383 start_codon:yes stop_codon:yes gene_type:complete
MKKAIYLIIEMKKRELDSKILLALKAVVNGYDVVISKKSRLFEKLHLLKPGIVFLKSFGTNYDIYLKDIKDYGHKLTGLDEEGLQVSHNSWIVGKRFSINVLNNLSCIFSWGDSAKNIYNSFIKKNKKKIKIISSGHPKIDILKNSSVKFYNIEANLIKKKYGKFVLIATQFPRYNNDIIDIKDNPEYFKEIYKGNKDVYSKSNVKLGLHQKKNFIEYYKMYKFLNKKFPNINFLVRPHPAENLNYYKELEEKNNFNNIKVLKSNDSIIPYIISSEVLIACNCTTSIESFLLNKYSINYVPWKDNASEFKLTKLLSLNAGNLLTLKKILKNKVYLKKNIVNKSKLNQAKKILKNLTNENSSEIIIKNLNLLNVNLNNIDNKKQNYLNFLYFFLKVKFQNIFYYVFKRNTNLYKVQLNKRVGFNKKEIQNKVNILSKIIYPHKKFIVREKYYGLFYIEILK